MSNRKERKQKRVDDLKKQRTVKEIAPKSINQLDYFKSISKNTINFVVGPPGAGKTFIALYHGIKMLQDGDVSKIIIIRPLVDVKNFDENKLGALPGSAKEKMQPWAGGILDNMHELLQPMEVDRMIHADMIEFFPLALCRGRTFHNAFIIVEEAQNISVEGDAMKMVLTRLGDDSKMVVAGDLKQSDLAPNKASALKDAIQKFYGEEGFGVIVLEAEDIMRHPIISTVLKKYGEETGKKITLDNILKRK